MDPLVFFAVLAAAAMHAGWNAVVKVGLDRTSSVLLLSFVQSAFALILLPFFALPAQAAWPWLAASALCHTGYKLFLIRAYEHGDLSQVYPLARGVAPMLVAIVGALALGEAMTVTKALAIVVIGLGGATMSLKGGGDFGRLPPNALRYALITSIFIAAYSLIDGVGARVALTASGFVLWMFVLDGLIMLGYGFAIRGRRSVTMLLPAWRAGLLAGSLSLTGYWIAVWAFTQAPIALVVALRETSVLFAMLIAVLFLRERAGPWRWIAAGLIVVGVAMIRI
jgi:drug/metabolite transporter (DMT)-like permease